ncbi:MAG: winged helix-turn-helix domain-containing protein [Pseudomonadales bacterium]|jgi:DNA-binding winged helix-turn-helix (wHTH) protein/tetratricopeptide (TPR) repeat protein|nr:winged helix-turn-helix domain-containing protein [Pseudomonadales bacterium]
MDAPARHDRFHIGDWTLVRSRNLLECGDAQHVLEPRAAELLVHLALRPGAVVSVDELLADVWSGRIVTESSVYRLVAELRRVLGDDSRAPRYIETVRKRGYRLVADVQVLPEPDADASAPGRTPRPPADDAPDRASPGPRRPATWSLAAAAALVIALVATLGVRLGNVETAGDRPPQTLAVLPLAPLSPDTPAFLADGLARTVSERLAAIPELTVLAYRSVREARAAGESGGGKPAQALGSDLVLSGSLLVGEAGDDGTPVRIGLSLESTQAGVQLWARSYEEELSDLYALHTRLVEEIARELDLRLAEPARERRVTESVPSAALEAWAAGRAELDRGYQAETLEAAVAAFTEALERAPDFVPALTGRAVAHIRLFSNYHDRSDARVAAARQDVDRALALDPADPETHYAHGYLLAQLGDGEGARRELARALELQPSHVDALVGLARAWSAEGDEERAVAYLESAVRLDPLNARFHYDLGMHRMNLGAYGDAERSFVAALVQAPAMVEALFYRSVLQITWRGDTVAANARLRELREAIGEAELLRLLLVPGLWGVFSWTEADFDEALARWSVEESGGDAAAWSLAMAEVAFKQGDRTLARSHYAEAARQRTLDLRQTPNDPWLQAELAIASAGAGLREEALSAADQAVALVPAGEDSWTGADFLWTRATTLLMLGEHDEAIEQVRRATRFPTLVTPPSLRVDAHWSPLFEREPFLALMDAEGTSWRTLPE